MKQITSNESYYASTDTLRSVDLSISQNKESQNLLFDSLSSLYKNRELAVVREYISNALDANKFSNSTNLVEVSLNCLENDCQSILVIKDSGLGMSPEIITQNFMQFGSTTKDCDNSQVGGFGLGSKCIHAVGWILELVTVCNGVKYYWEIFERAAHLISEELSTDSSGTTISIYFPTKIYDYMRTYAWHIVYCYSVFYPNTIKFDSELVKIKGTLIKKDCDEKFSKFPKELAIVSNKCYNSLHFEYVYLVGGIPIYVNESFGDFDELSIVNNFDRSWTKKNAFFELNTPGQYENTVFINVPVGFLELMRSRESFAVTETNKELFNNFAQKLVDSLENFYNIESFELDKFSYLMYLGYIFDLKPKANIPAFNFVKSICRDELGNLLYKQEYSDTYILNKEECKLQKYIPIGCAPTSFDSSFLDFLSTGRRVVGVRWSKLEKYVKKYSLNKRQVFKLLAAALTELNYDFEYIFCIFSGWKMADQYFNYKRLSPIDNDLVLGDSEEFFIIFDKLAQAAPVTVKPKVVKDTNLEKHFARALTNRVSFIAYTSLESVVDNLGKNPIVNEQIMYMSAHKKIDFTYVGNKLTIYLPLDLFIALKNSSSIELTHNTNKFLHLLRGFLYFNKGFTIEQASAQVCFLQKQQYDINVHNYLNSSPYAINMMNSFKYLDEFLPKAPEHWRLCKDLLGQDVFLDFCYSQNSCNHMAFQHLLNMPDELNNIFLDNTDGRKAFDMLKKVKELPSYKVFQILLLDYLKDKNLRFSDNSKNIVSDRTIYSTATTYLDVISSSTKFPTLIELDRDRQINVLKELVAFEKSILISRDILE